ncbi:MAG: NADH-quinone oxidoreductase subunit NuoE [Anaerolineae bacterium]|nr:NADH-quinone oxidoreductase subunit NuoE [Anaerolineae bacterium]
MSEQTVDDIDLSVVDQMIERYGTTTDAAIPILLGLQETYGYLPFKALQHVTEKTEATPNQVYGVATFYGQFRMKPVGRHIVRVCHGTACHVRGAVGIDETLMEVMGLAGGEDTTADMEYTVEKVACLGCCSLSPVIMVDDKVYGKLTRQKVRKIFQQYAREEVEQ